MAHKRVARDGARGCKHSGEQSIDSRANGISLLWIMVA